MNIAFSLDGGSTTDSGGSSDDTTDSGTNDSGGSGGFLSGFRDSVRRQFDDKTGDGFADDAQDVAETTLGVTQYQESEDFKRINEQYNETQGDTSLRGHAKRFDLAARAGFDYALDNPNASLQEGVQGGMTEAYRFGSGNENATSEDVARSFQESATNVKQSWDESTPDDGAVGGALKAGGFLTDAFIADPTKAAFTGVTGVDIDEGSTEGTVGAVDAADVGITVGTAGLGGAGISALRGASKSDEGAKFLSRFLGGSDEGAAAADNSLDAFNAGGRSADDATPALTSGDDTAQVVDDASSSSDDVIDLTATGEETAGGFRRFVANLGDEGAAASDDAATKADNTPALTSGADDATGASDGFGGFVDDVLGGADDAASGADDVATKADDAATGAADAEPSMFQKVGGLLSDEGARLSEDIGRLFDDTASGADDVATKADDAATGADDVASKSDEMAQGGEDAVEQGGRFSRYLSGRSGAAMVGTGGFLAGGALVGSQMDPTDAPKNLTTASGHNLIHSKDYPQTDRFEAGRLYAVTKENRNLGYWLLVGVNGRNMTVLDADGNERSAKIDAEQFNEMMQAKKGGSQ